MQLIGIKGHRSEIISVDVYGDNKQLIADRLIELDEFIESIDGYIKNL